MTTLKRVKIAPGRYRVGHLEIQHACGVVWELWDGDEHIASDLTLGEACVTARDILGRTMSASAQKERRLSDDTTNTDRQRPA
jgi:hypothetical protein